MRLTKLIKKRINQKGQSISNVLVIVVILAIALIAGLYLLKNKSNTAYQTNQSNQPTQQTSTTFSIQTDNDLTNTSSELDNEDVDGTVDLQLSKNDTDSQTFSP